MDKKITKICYVGAGTMGSYNALIAAIAGYSVVLYDQSSQVLSGVDGRQREIAGMLAASGKIPAGAIEQAWKRITTSDDLATALEGVDLVSESVTESLEVKRAIHRTLEEMAAPGTILTTNTSALLPSDIDSALDSGRNFAALHSYLGSPLVDIVAGPRTAGTIPEALVAFVRSVGGVPLVMKKEYPGYILNSLLGPLLTTAMLLVSRGQASVEQVDRCWMAYMKAPMGPFGMMDFFGINVVFDSWCKTSLSEEKKRHQPEIRALLQPLVESGYTGMKAGRGFYQYPEPAYGAPAFFEQSKPDSDSFQVLLRSVVQASLLIVAEGAASFDEVNFAWCVGTGLGNAPLELMQSDQYGPLRSSILAGNHAISLLSADQHQSICAVMSAQAQTA